MRAAPGRHRIGTPPEQVVTSRQWGPGKRATAAQLDQMEPTWQVTYGVWHRLFFAVALWSAEPLMVSARTAEHLRQAMREAETDGMTPPAPTPGRQPTGLSERQPAWLSARHPAQQSGRAA